MPSGTQDRAESQVDEAKGHVKETVGKVTGNDQTRAEGVLDQAAGKAKQGLADIKDKVGDLVDKAKSS